MPLKLFSVGAGGGTDVVPAAVKHHEAFAVPADEGSLQTAVVFSQLSIGPQSNAFWFPIETGQFVAFPGIEQTSVADFLGAANAGPELPFAVNCLPDGEVYGLLFLGK